MKTFAPNCNDKANSDRIVETEMQCAICRNSDSNKFYQAREMQFDMDGDFIYMQCSNCDCLQMIDIPNDLGKYYPSYYSAFQNTKKQISHRLKVWTRHRRDFTALYGKGFWGALILRLFPLKTDSYLCHYWFKTIFSYPCNTKILDVGCGDGRLLHDLARLGFTNLTGVDLYVPQFTPIPEGGQFYKRNNTRHRGRI